MGFTARKLLVKNNKITWIQTSLPSSLPWNSVAYGNGIFVAVNGNSNLASLSTDGGKTWSQSTLPSSASWRDVVFGGGVFMACRLSGSETPSPSSAAIAYSSTGSSWTQVSISVSVSRLAYGNGRFVGFRDVSGNQMIYSSNNGLTWTTASLPTSFACRAVTYGNGRFVAIGSGNSLYSNDGITWVATSTAQNYSVAGVTYGNGRFVCVGITGYGLYSDDGGETWTQFLLPSTAINWRKVSYGNGIFVAPILTNGFGYSNNGIDWQVSPMPSSNDWIPIGFGGGKFVALTNNTNIAAYTT
jgi:hypothetical protein